jgi:hypothetical protein
MSLLQFTHGNFDVKQNAKAITLTLNHTDISPALIKSAILEDKNTRYDNTASFYAACCFKNQKIDSNTDKINILSQIASISFLVTNTILSGHSSQKFLSINQSDNKPSFWNKLNNARWDLELKICYCSMLDECYSTEKNGTITPIKQCP